MHTTILHLLYIEHKRLTDRLQGRPFRLSGVAANGRGNLSRDRRNVIGRENGLR